MEITTCQICGRPIKSKVGKIAHHGFKRPGNGWQTSSCYGARYLPYEVSRDRIPVVIRNIAGWIVVTEKYVADMKLNPPDELKYTTGTWTKTTHTVLRPEGFTSEKEPYSSRPYTYESEFWHTINNATREIASARYEIERLQERFDKWVAPEKVETE